MPIQLKEEAGGELVVCVSGILTKEDYDRMLPELEPILRQHGKWRILFEMTDFHGWEPAALWEELKFDGAYFRNFSDIDGAQWLATRSGKA